MKTASDCQQSKDSENNACHQRGKIKRKTQGAGNGVRLNSAENYAIGDEQKDGEQNAHPAHPSPRAIYHAGPPRNCPLTSRSL